MTSQTVSVTATYMSYGKTAYEPNATQVTPAFNPAATVVDFPRFDPSATVSAPLKAAKPVKRPCLVMPAYTPVGPAKPETELSKAALITAFMTAMIIAAAVGSVLTLYAG